ncbi:MAG: hypothetical protein ABI609_10525 [Acidobacteriota bacterium]
MTVQELTVVHQRYIDLSDRFRAAWTFHQFLQGLQKIFLESSPGQYPADFQGLYNTLKDISQNLNASEIVRVRTQLDGIERQLGQLNGALLQEDGRVSPSLLRQFFQRVKNYDEKILTQLAKFYIFSCRAGSWDPDRVDKVDFLLTKLGEEAPGSFNLRDRGRLRDIFRGLWAATGVGGVLATELEERRRSLDAVRAEIAQIDDFEQLADLRLVRRYRDFKHGLGNLLFEPDMLLTVLETNLAMKAKVRQLYTQEERRIFSESQRIFELEREVPLDGQLDEDLTHFRREMERFERGLQDDNVRLEEMGSLRSQVQSLIPRLTGGAETGLPAKPSAPVPTPTSGGVGNRGPEPLVAAHFDRLITALESANHDEPPKTVTLQREVFPMRLDPREVIAYRRLQGIEPQGDRALEQFVLECAALRVRINEEAEDITGILDDTSITRDTPVFARARLTCRGADNYARRYDAAVDNAVLEGNVSEAQTLQVLRMRLLRDYSGLWLLANKR